jgi:glycerophosphoryl diester phosphodiesterase
VEPDLVITREGILVARHENEIGATTDVAARPEFASRRTTKVIDGKPVSGWFTEDFTLAELKTLRARERIPNRRPANTRFDGMFEVPTFEEVLALVRDVNERRRQAGGGKDVKRVGIYPETKHPSYFQGIGLPLEEPLVKLLERHGYASADDRAYIQSFEVANLRKLAKMTKVKLVQLLSDTGGPWDFVAAGDPRTYADLAQPAGLKEIAGYASGIGPHKNLVIPRVNGVLGSATPLVREAHALKLVVHGWTYRAENAFLPAEFRKGADPNAIGDLAGEIARFVELGIDGFFTDHPDLAVKGGARP